MDWILFIYSCSNEGLHKIVSVSQFTEIVGKPYFSWIETKTKYTVSRFTQSERFYFLSWVWEGRIHHGVGLSPTQALIFGETSPVLTVGLELCKALGQQHHQNACSCVQQHELHRTLNRWGISTPSGGPQRVAATEGRRAGERECFLSF